MAEQRGRYYRVPVALLPEHYNLVDRLAGGLRISVGRTAGLLVEEALRDKQVIYRALLGPVDRVLEEKKSGKKGKSGG